MAVPRDQNDRQNTARSKMLRGKSVTPNRYQRPLESTSNKLRRQPKRSHHRDNTMSKLLMMSVCLQFVTYYGAHAFTMIPVMHKSVGTIAYSTSALQAGRSSGASKKKRRKRKQTIVAPDNEPEATLNENPSASGSIDLVDDKQEPVDINMINEVANFRFEPKKDETTSEKDKSGSGNRGSAIPLPDIKEARKKKELEEELARKQQEEEANKVKIKRSDKDAFRKLLEQQPFADADDSLFVEEEYGAVSALLGERAKPFLGIPLGPLQVGHFIGALGIILMAFCQYPGFPLTNLPTPLRSSLQGGLATIFTINAVLAGLVALKAPERGQPVALWVPKTFAVGGLAYDQLMQLPTLGEVEKAKAVKGRRSLKNNKKK